MHDLGRYGEGWGIGMLAPNVTADLSATNSAGTGLTASPFRVSDGREPQTVNRGELNQDGCRSMLLTNRHIGFDSVVGHEKATCQAKASVLRSRTDLSARRCAVGGNQ